MTIEIENVELFNVSEVYEDIAAGRIFDAYRAIEFKAKASPYRLAARCTSLVNYTYQEQDGARIDRVLKVINGVTTTVKNVHDSYRVRMHLKE